jgi:citrate lyase subunit beta/citryl-CoA lyase
MLTLLYVPGDRPDRFAKAVASGAGAVIVDLEDAVHPDRKAAARAAAAEFCQARHRVPVQVRVNAPGSPDFAADLDALARAAPAGPLGIRLPKVEDPADIARTVARAGFAVELHCILETALGVERAFAIATAGPEVASIGLGESDLRSDLGLRDDAGLGYARGRIVLAARAAKLPPPAMSVYPDVRDLAGLAASCRAGAALGFVGRAAIHPAQLPVIEEAFRPAPAEVDRAREILAALDAARDRGQAVAVLPDGRFADPAMVRQAQRIVDLA